MSVDVEGHIYLICFAHNPVSHASHYLGFAETGGLFRRLAQHEAGNGAATPLTRTLKKQGGSFTLSRTWTGSRFDERKLKRRGSKRRLCPICSPTVKASPNEKVRWRNGRTIPCVQVDEQNRIDQEDADAFLRHAGWIHA